MSKEKPKSSSEEKKNKDEKNQKKKRLTPNQPDPEKMYKMVGDSAGPGKAP